MSCSKKYRDLVVTSSGYTPDNQYGWYPTPWTYEEWRTLAAQLLIRTKVHLDRLQNKTDSPAATEESNGYVEQYNSFVERNEALPSPFLGTFHETDTVRSVSLAADIAVETVCLMEAIDKSLAAAGIKPPGEPRTVSPSTSPKSQLSSLMMLGLLGGGAYLYWRFGR